jgi:hypothetical protein
MYRRAIERGNLTVAEVLVRELESPHSSSCSTWWRSLR